MNLAPIALGILIGSYLNNKDIREKVNKGCKMFINDINNSIGSLEKSLSNTIFSNTNNTNNTNSNNNDINK